MKFLVVGASGFLGGTILRRLRAKGFEVTGTQCAANRPGLIRFDLARDRITECVPQAFFRGNEPVCAIVATTARAMDECATREWADHVHIDCTLQLLKDLAARGVRVLFVSTGYVFDGSVGYYTENDEPRPISQYGRQKLAVEVALSATVPDALVFRLEKIVSDEMASRNLFTQWLNAIRGCGKIECIRNQIFAPTAGRDIADASLAAFEKQLCGLFHVCNTEFFLREELAFQFCRTTGLQATIVSRPVEEFGFADPRPLKTYLDASKFQQATGFVFTPVRKVMEGFRENCVSARLSPS